MVVMRSMMSVAGISEFLEEDTHVRDPVQFESIIVSSQFLLPNTVHTAQLVL